MDHISLIGYVAAAFTTFAYVPQAVKIYRTRHTTDLSIWMLVILTAGIFLWAIYGVLIKNDILILANLVSLVISLYVLLMKVRHG